MVDFQESVFITVINNKHFGAGEVGAQNGELPNFYKDSSWKPKMQNAVRYDVYSDNLVMGSTYVIKNKWRQKQLGGNIRRKNNMT